MGAGQYPDSSFQARRAAGRCPPHTGANMSQTPVTTPQPATTQNDPKRFTWTASSQQRRGQAVPVPAGSSGK